MFANWNLNLNDSILRQDVKVNVARAKIVIFFVEQKWRAKGVVFLFIPAIERKRKQ